MDALWKIVVAVGHGIEQVLTYVDTHHRIFGFLVPGGNLFLPSRPGSSCALRRAGQAIDEIRKRLAIEY